MDCDRVAEIFGKHSAEEYRESDKLVKRHKSYKHYCDILRSISSSFRKKNFVLDIGCGTGRYFYCLKNVKLLVGVDISSYMLEKAHNPINKEEIDIENFELLCGDIFGINIDQSFDFIYSIGVLGEYAPFNLYICNKLFDILKPNGKLFFTVVDIHSRMQPIYSRTKPVSLKRRIVGKVFPFLPLSVKEFINRRSPSFYMTMEEIEKVMESSHFTEYQISRYIHREGWIGAHYDCITFKS